METTEKIIVPPKEYNDFYKLKLKNIESFYKNVSKINSEKNSNLNWGTTIITALLVYYCTKMLEITDVVNFLFFIISVILYIAFIIYFIKYKSKSISYETSTVFFIGTFQDYIDGIDNVLLVSNIMYEEKYIKYSNTIIDSITHYTDGSLEELNPTISKHTKVIFDSLEELDRYYKIGFKLFIAFIILLPIYAFYTAFSKYLITIHNSLGGIFN